MLHTLQNYSNGTIFPEEVNREAQKRMREEEIPPDEEEIDLYPPRKIKKQKRGY